MIKRPHKGDPKRDPIQARRKSYNYADSPRTPSGGIWRATDPHPGPKEPDQVIIKVLDSQDATAIKDFRDNWERTRQLGTKQDSYVVKVLDDGTLPSGEPFVVLEEYVESLDTYIKRYVPCYRHNKSLLAGRAWTILSRLAQAVDLAWQFPLHGKKGHHDICPGNVLITSRSLEEDPTVALTDFGTSPSDGVQAYSRPHSTGNQQDDIYSLGRLLFFMMTAREPQFRTADELQRQMADHPQAAEIIRQACFADNVATTAFRNASEMVSEMRQRVPGILPRSPSNRFLVPVLLAFFTALLLAITFIRPMSGYVVANATGTPTNPVGPTSIIDYFELIAFSPTTSVPGHTPIVLTPTHTPTPTPTDTPSPIPTDTPSPIPTDTPSATPTNTPSPTATYSSVDVGRPPAPPSPIPTRPGCRPRSCYTHCRLASPAPGSVITGDYKIIGRANWGNFGYYKLEFCPYGTSCSLETDTGDYQLIVEPRAPGGQLHFEVAPADQNELATWRTGTVPNGCYIVRLRVVTLTGDYPQPDCKVIVTVQNATAEPDEQSMFMSGAALLPSSQSDSPSSDNILFLFLLFLLSSCGLLGIWGIYHLVMRLSKFSSPDRRVDGETL